jgi:hypothetical protein
VTEGLIAKILEQKETFVAILRHCQNAMALSIRCYATVGNHHVIAATVTQATKGELLKAVFSTGFVPRRQLTSHC